MRSITSTVVSKVNTQLLRKLEDTSLIWLSTVPLVLDKLHLLMKIMQYDWKLQNSYYRGLILRWGCQNQHSLSKLVIKTTTKAFISVCSYKLLLNQLLYMWYPSHYIKSKTAFQNKTLQTKKQTMLPLIPCASLFSLFFSLLVKFTIDRNSERFTQFASREQTFHLYLTRLKPNLDHLQNICWLKRDQDLRAA